MTLKAEEKFTLKFERKIRFLATNFENIFQLANNLSENYVRVRRRTNESHSKLGLAPRWRWAGVRKAAPIVICFEISVKKNKNEVYSKKKNFFFIILRTSQNEPSRPVSKARFPLPSFFSDLNRKFTLFPVILCTVFLLFSTPARNHLSFCRERERKCPSSPGRCHQRTLRRIGDDGL